MPTVTIKITAKMLNIVFLLVCLLLLLFSVVAKIQLGECFRERYADEGRLRAACAPNVIKFNELP